MKTFVKYVMIVALALPFLSSCVDEHIFSQPDREKQMLVDALESYEAFATLASEITFNISSNTPWTIECDEQWCQVSPKMSASAGLVAVVTVKLDDNKSYDERTAIITISADDVVEDVLVTIKQEGKSKFKVTSTETQIASQGGSLTFEVLSSKEWSMSPNIPKWLTFDVMEGEGSDAPITVTATAEANTGAVRTADVTVVSGAEERTFAVKQLGYELAFVEVTNPDALTFPTEGGELEMSVSSSFDDWVVACNNADIVIKQDDKASRKFTVVVPTSYRFTPTKFTLSLTAGEGQYSSSEDMILTQGQFLLPNGNSAFSYEFMESHVINADGSVTVTNLAGAPGQQGRVFANFPLMPGTYSFKFRDVDQDTFAAAPFFNLHLEGGPMGRRYVANIAKNVQTIMGGATVDATSRNDLSGVTNHNVELSMLIDAADNSKMSIITKVNDMVVADQQMANIWKDAPGVPQNQDIYFGIPRDTKIVESITIESVVFTPQN